VSHRPPPTRPLQMKNLAPVRRAPARAATATRPADHLMVDRGPRAPRRRRTATTTTDGPRFLGFGALTLMRAPRPPNRLSGPGTGRGTGRVTSSGRPGPRQPPIAETSSRGWAWSRQFSRFPLSPNSLG